MKIEIRKSAIKDLKNISEPFKNNINNKILDLTNFPNILGNTINEYENNK